MAMPDVLGRGPCGDGIAIPVPAPVGRASHGVLLYCFDIRSACMLMVSWKKSDMRHPQLSRHYDEAGLVAPRAQKTSPEWRMSDFFFSTSRNQIASEAEYLDEPVCTRQDLAIAFTHP